MSAVAAPIDVSGLRDDGDTVTMPDGRMLRLKVTGDEHASINNYDSDGKIEYVRDRRNDYGYPPQRPAGFDGAAVKISDGSIWWQPCEGAVYETPEAFRRDKQRIADLCEFGFVVVTLELCDGTDAYGRPIVVKAESLGGNEWDCMSEPYGAELVADLVTELLP